MSFAGSIASISSRISDISQRSTAIHAGCRLDPSTRKGRKKLAFLLFFFPSLPSMILVIVTIVRLSFVSRHLESLTRTYDVTAEQTDILKATMFIRKEMMAGSLFVTSFSVPDGSHSPFPFDNDTCQLTNLTLLYSHTDDAIANIGDHVTVRLPLTTGYSVHLKECVSMHLTKACLQQLVLESRNLLSNGTDPAAISAGRQYYNDANNLLQSAISDAPSIDINKAFSIYYYARVELDRSSHFISKAYMDGNAILDQRKTGYTDRSDLIINTEKAIHHLELSLQFLSQNNTLVELDISLLLAAFVNLTKKISRGNDSYTHLNETCEWYSVCHQLQDVIQNWMSTLGNNIYNEVLNPERNIFFGYFVGCVLAIVIQIPLIILITNNSTVTTQSIYGTMTMFSNRTNELKKEKRRTELLLSEMLPKSVAKQLRLGNNVLAEQFEKVTVLFSDIENFNDISSISEPMQMVTFLNSVYSFMDSTIECYDVYKVETIGSTYMVVSGLPVRNADRHVTEISNMALEIMASTDSFVIPHLPGKGIKLRMGAHTGPCCAGVVGNRSPRYCLFGDTVNTASRMQSTGLAEKIHVSGLTRDELELIGGYILEHRGSMHIKGKGAMNTHWLLAKKKKRRGQSNHVRMNVQVESMLES